ncbi:MAG: GNAT family N-acetyltransferase, partial [Cryobacterium sp.]|nr:GNAT family N-acetyltransferase [Oligoflexia bacterium]
KGGFGRSAYLRLIVVAPGAYSSGVGSALMAELERRHCLSDRLKGPGLFLLCTHTNTGAQNFYAKLGYARVGEIPSYLRPALNEVIYWKP